WDPSEWKSVHRENSPWYKAYGDGSYIVDAFDMAKAADPDAELYYNDYSICDSGKRDRVVKMINELDLKSHGLTGVGIQAHWSIAWPPISSIQETIDVFHKMGLDVQITELDINCYDNDKSSVTRAYGNFENTLAKRYEEIFKLFRRNKDKITNVTFWGVADDHTWLDTFYGDGEQKKARKNYPFLFDAKHKKKKAYSSVNDF
ncbi:MAG TPA: glycoside hydrolase, partial [Treponema sp.]|nr:glycoside hydrolase [Treponema sp.]